MVFSYGKKIRRLAAQVLSADAEEMRALRQRLLPRGEEGAPVLRIASEADRTAAPAAILSAVLADEITAEEADALMQLAESAELCQQEQSKPPWWDGPRLDFSRMSEEEIREANAKYWRPELDPLADAIRAWGRPSPHHIHDASRCAAASGPGALVTINENTSAAPGGDAASGGRQADVHL
jgi:hypothetical protein